MVEDGIIGAEEHDRNDQFFELCLQWNPFMELTMKFQPIPALGDFVHFEYYTIIY